MEPILWRNGRLVPLSEASVSVLDQGFLLGDGVFDVVSAWKGVLFKLDAHLDRFFDSLRAARLETPMTRDDWREAILATARANDLQDASIRFIVTRGVPSGIVADPRVFEPTTIVWAAPYIFLADDERRRSGIRLFLSHARGFATDSLDPRYKCLDRLHFQLAKLEALDAGYDDVVWLDAQGYVAEGPASNLFMVKDGTLYTPGERILHGITRATVLELAERLGIPSRQASLTAYDLFCADEVFTTSTAGGVLPVREVAARPLPQPVAGPVTRALDEAYWTMREAGEHGTPL
jgi:branched-chain amino acid aminotransferase